MSPQWWNIPLAKPVTNACTSWSRRSRISEGKTTKSDDCRFSEAIESRDVFSLRLLTFQAACGGASSGQTQPQNYIVVVTATSRCNPAHSAGDRHGSVGGAGR